jgi:hypothetical protein
MKASNNLNDEYNNSTANLLGEDAVSGLIALAILTEAIDSTADVAICETVLA